MNTEQPESEQQHGASTGAPDGIANLMAQSAIAVALAAAIWLLLSGVEGGSWQISGLAAGLLVVALSSFRLRRSQPQRAAWLLVGGGWLAVALASVQNGGVASPLFTLLALVVFLAGMFFERRIALALALLSIALGVVLVLLDGGRGAALLAQQGVVLGLTWALAGATRRGAQMASAELSAQKQQVARVSAEKTALQRTLAATEAARRFTLDSAPNAVFIVDKSRNRITYANENALTLFGYSLQAFTGMQPQMLCPPNSTHMADPRAVWQQQVAASQKRPVVEPFEWIVLDRSSNERMVEVHLVTLPDDATHVQATVIDMSGQVQSAADLRVAQRRFEQLVNHIDQVFWLLSPDEAHVYYVSPAYEKLTGRPRSELYQNATAWQALVHPDDRHLVPTPADDGGIAPNTVRDASYRLLLDDGAIKWVWYRSWPMFDGAQLTGWAAVSADVTPQRATQLALEDATQRLQLITDNVPACIAYVDASERLLFTNAHGCEPGLDRRDGIGRILRELLPPAQYQKRQPYLAAALEGREVTFDLTVEIDPIGARLKRHTYVPHAQNGAVVGLFMLSVDITEQRRAEIALRQADKLDSMGDLAGGIAHDFSNLLVALMGQTAIAQAKLSADSPAQRHLAKAQAAAERAAALTRQMLAYSGQGQFEWRVIDMNELVRGSIGRMRPSLPDAVTIAFEPMAALPRIRVDADQIEQAIANLIANAAQSFNCSVGKITITTGLQSVDHGPAQDAYVAPDMPPATGIYVYVDVQDDGEGIDEALLQHIFDPFFTTSQGRPGLGLAAVHGIIRGHKGYIDVTSQPGSGTRVRLLLPDAARAKAPSAST